MRTCGHCGFVGEDKDFAWNYSMRVDGTKVKMHYNVCKKCNNKRSYQSLKNKKYTDPVYYFTEQNWKTLNQKCVNGRYCNSESVRNSPQMQSYHKQNIELHITKEQLYQFWKDNESKVREIMAKGQTPTIDRINDNGHYSLDNIQILSLTDNIHKSRGYAKNPKPYDKESRKNDNRKQYLKNKKNKEGE